MTVWIIVVVSCGEYVDVQFATSKRVEAEDEYRRLVREAMSYAHRDNPWEDVEAEYRAALEDHDVVEEYYLYNFEVED